MVLSPDEHLNLRANIKATMQSLDARIRAGGNWRGSASVARELAEKLEALADLDDRRGARVRYQYPEDEPVDPISRSTARRYQADPLADLPDHNKRRYEVKEVKREQPKLPPG